MNEVGTPAERAILGYVIDRPDRRLGLDELTADDFSDPTLGAIWDGISSDLIVGKTLDVVTLELRFADWGIVGEAADMCRVKMWDWVESGHSITLTQPIIDLIKRDATQRFAMHRMRSAISELGSGEHDPGTVLHGVVRDIHDRASGSKKEMFDSFMLGDLLEMEFTEDFVIPGLLERQDRVIITGVEGYGKSTLARQILLYSAAGLHPFEEHMGIPLTIPKPTKCLVIDAENTVKQWSRNASWMVKKIHRYVQPGGRYTVSPAQNVVVVPTGRLNILKPEHLGMIHKLIDQHEPDIVFIGPLYRITRGGMNEENEAMEAIAALDTIRDRGVALVMEAHSGHSKDGNQRATRPRGSSALLGWPEFGMGIRPVVEFTPSGPVPQMGKFELNAWRGARERDRKWPEFLTHGTPNDPFPWMSDDEEEPDDGGYGSVGPDGVVPG